jgi:hypothetical protein
MHVIKGPSLSVLSTFYLPMDALDTVHTVGLVSKWLFAGLHIKALDY